MTDNSGTSAVSLSQMHVQQMKAVIVLNGKLEFFITLKNAQEMSVPCGWDLSNLLVFWFLRTRGGAGLKINRHQPGLQGNHTHFPGPRSSEVPPTLALVSLHLSPQCACLQRVLNKWHQVKNYSLKYANICVTYKIKTKWPHFSISVEYKKKKVIPFFAKRENIYVV